MLGLFQAGSIHIFVRFVAPNTMTVGCHNHHGTVFVRLQTMHAMQQLAQHAIALHKQGCKLSQQVVLSWANHASHR
jgi:hypothetical protein